MRSSTSGVLRSELPVAVIALPKAVTSGNLLGRSLPAAVITACREDAVGETAHFICELFLRLRSVGQTDGYSFPLPLTQAELGDVLGLSTVHVNRTIQELRGDGLLTWNRDHVVIEDWDRLCKIAQFDAAYLNLENEPR